MRAPDSGERTISFSTRLAGPVSVKVGELLLKEPPSTAQGDHHEVRSRCRYSCRDVRCDSSKCRYTCNRIAQWELQQHNRANRDFGSYQWHLQLGHVQHFLTQSDRANHLQCRMRHRIFYQRRLSSSHHQGGWCRGKPGVGKPVRALHCDQCCVCLGRRGPAIDHQNTAQRLPQGSGIRLDVWNWNLVARRQLGCRRSVIAAMGRIVKVRSGLLGHGSPSPE